MALGASLPGEPTASPWLGVPIARRPTASIGVISLQNLDRETPSARPTCGCSRTLAASLSVALENARLFDETKRLLTETNERAAELAIINSVQQGLAASSTCRRCTTSSATRSRRSSTPRSSTSASTTEPADLIALPVHDRARRPLPRRADRARSASAGSSSRRDRLLLVNDDAAPSTRESDVRATGIAHRRAAQVGPLRAAASSAASHGRDLAPEPRPRGAFSESDVRLLTTLAASLSVASRTPGCSTRRAPAGRDRRAGRRAGDHQRRPAGPRRSSSTCRRCTTSSATRSSEIFDAQVVDIGIYDDEAGHDPLPVHHRARRRLPDEPIRARSGSASTSSRPRQPLLIDDVRASGAPSTGNPRVDRGRAAEVGPLRAAHPVGERVAA